MKKITLTNTQQILLANITRNTTSPQRLVRRAGIILASEQTPDQTAVARTMKINRNTVSLWLNRWQESGAELDRLEAEYVGGLLSKPMYQRALADILTDAQRPGTPPTITEAQKADILALAAEKPVEAGVPITHWTVDTLRAAIIAKGIIAAISRAHTGRFLKQSHTQTS